MLTLSLPSLSALTEKRALKVEAEQLKIVLEKLLISAMEREEELLLILQERSYQAKSKDKNMPIIAEHALKPPVVIALAGTEHILRLYKSGVVTPATVTLSAGTVTCKVVLSLRGRVNTRC